MKLNNTVHVVLTCWRCSHFIRRGGMGVSRSSILSDDHDGIKTEEVVAPRYPVRERPQAQLIYTRQSVTCLSQCVWPGDHSMGAVNRTPVIPDKRGVATC